VLCSGPVSGAATSRSHLRRVGLLVGGLLACAQLVAAHPAFEDVERHSTQLVAERPDDPAAYLTLAQTRRIARDWDGALVALEHAAAHGAQPVEVTALRAAVFLDAGWSNMALLEADRALLLDAGQPQVQILRGRASLALGRPQEAARAFALAIEGTRNPTPDQVLVLADALVAAGDRPGAVAALDHGLTRIGLVPSLALPALDLELEIGRADAALRRIDALLATNARNELWLARRGEVLDRLGRNDEARVARAGALAAIQSRPDGRRGSRSASLERELRSALAPEDHPPPDAKERP